MYLLLMFVLALGQIGGEVLPDHPAELPALTPDTTFPRCTAAELESAGFPDHMHAHLWPTWQVLTDDQGQTYGPGAFCDRKTPLPREGLVIAEDHKAFGFYKVKHNPAYAACDMLPLLELLTWADRSTEQLLGLTAQDTLTVITPDNIPSYRKITGQDVWRLYALRKDVVVIEPYGTLQARSLDAHAAFALVTDWLLRENLPAPLPPWLHFGLTEYLAENGVHLNNYMLQFREQGPVMFSPLITDTILSQAPDPDRGRDREMYRRASYSAFLMVWRLVEERGGLKAVRQLLEEIQEGASVDDAALAVYGVSMNELANQLDPVKLGEPQGQANESRRPQSQP
jgi:hypothetical protein